MSSVKAVAGLIPDHAAQTDALLNMGAGTADDAVFEYDGRSGV